jgi:SAM-dependent methyltransferase
MVDDALPAIRLFEERASQYDAWFTEGPGRVIFPMELAALRLLTALTSGPTLEAGCGTGAFSGSLRVDLGVDPSRSALEIARGRGVPVAQGVAEALPVRDGAFGCVLFVASLCYIADPLAAFREARRALRPGGDVIVAEVNRESAWGRDYLTRRAGDDPFYRLATLYTMAETEALLGRAGFRPRAHASTLLQPPGPSLRPVPPVPEYVPEAGFVYVLAGRD